MLTRHDSKQRSGLLAPVGVVLLVVLTTAVVSHATPAATLRDVRHIAEPGMTRLIIELSEPVHYRIQTIDPHPSAGVPARVYIDLAGVRLDDPQRVASRLPEGPLQRVKAAPHGAAGTRLILDVPGLREWQAFPMSDPYRVVIDIRGTPRPRRHTEPAAAAALPPNAAGALPASATQVAATAPLTVPVTTADARGRGAAAPPRRRVKIVIDAGHGGKDPGASGIDGLAEKDVTLAIAKRLQVRLRDDVEAEVVLTRTTDVFLTLQERTARANAEGADLFVSIHANASANGKLAGAETYYLNNTDDHATLRLAGMENGWRTASGSGAQPHDVALILSDLVQNYKIQESVALAGAVQDALVSELAAAGTPVNDLGVKQGPFYVLVGAAMPCVLVEVSFLTHPLEGKLLGRASYQESIAAGLLRGIRRFVQRTEVADNL